MRTRLVMLAGLLGVAACGPAPAIIYVPTPAPDAVEPAPEPDPLPPVGITVVREEATRLLLSTNQPAHVAVFEIIPNQGVFLVHPVSPRMRNVTHAGSGWVPVARPDDESSFARGARSARERSTVRYVYAIASDRPLRLTTASFAEDYLRETLGNRLYRAADPFATMDALVRTFVPSQPDESWGEDLYTVETSRRTTPRLARVYCRDGSVLYVRDDLADRTACPMDARGGSIASRVSSRPDSIVLSTGRRVAYRVEPRDRGPIVRVGRPVAGNAGNNGNNGNNGNAGNNGIGQGIGGGRTERGNDGNRGNGQGGVAAGNPGNGNNGNAGSNGNAGNGAANGNTGNDGGNGNRGGPVWRRPVEQAGKPQSTQDATPATPTQEAAKPAQPAHKPVEPVARPPRGRPALAKPDSVQPEAVKPDSAKADSVATPARPAQAKPGTAKPVTRPAPAKPTSGPLWRRTTPPRDTTPDSTSRKG